MTDDQTRLPRPRSLSRTILFYAILFALPVVVPVAAVMAYYAYQKLVTPTRIDAGYAKLDGELGWVLQPGARSRYWMVDRISGETVFDATVWTDESGFRIAQHESRNPRGGVVAAGDSWTFGYAVPYEQSYPAILDSALGRRVVNMGVPAYGLAQVIVLLERHVKRLRPTHVVHLNRGLWERSMCHGATAPRHIVKPCFWYDERSGNTALVLPRPGYVEDLAAGGIYPGGWLTAGDNSWAYYLVSRPITRFKQLLTQAGLMPGHQSESDPDPVLAPRVLAYALHRLLDRAMEDDFRLVLLDPLGDYETLLGGLSSPQRARLDYLSPQMWIDEIQTPSRSLPPHEQYVPHDGHYAVGFNRLIAAAVARRIRP